MSAPIRQKILVGAARREKARVSLSFPMIVGSEAGRHEVKLEFLHFWDFTRFGFPVPSLVGRTGSRCLLQVDRKFCLELGSGQSRDEPGSLIPRLAGTR